MPSAPASAIRAWSIGCRCSTSASRRCSTTLPGAPVSFDHLADEAVEQRFALIRDHYTARAEGLETQAFGAPPYKPVPPEAMFLTAEEWQGAARRTPGAPSHALRAAGRGPGPGALHRRARGTQLRRGARQRGGEPLRCGHRPRARTAGSGQARDRRRLHGGRARAAGNPVRRAWARRRPQGRELRRGGGAAPRAARALPCSAWSRASRRPISPSSASRTSSATGWCARAARRAGPPTSSPRRPASPSAISWCTPTTASAASTGSPPSPRSAPRTTAWRSATPAATSSTCRWRTSSCCPATAPPTAPRSSTGWAASPGRPARHASSSASARWPPSSSRSRR